MIWFGLYAATAFVVGSVLFVAAEFQRAPGIAPPRFPGVYAFVAGLLWPVLVIAVAQGGLLLGVSRRLRRTAGPARVPQKVG